MYRSSASLSFSSSSSITFHSSPSNQEAKLFIAIESGRVDEVKEICTSGIKLDCKNTAGQTPLIAAITRTPIKQRLAMVQYFVEEKKASLHDIDDKWQSPLTYCFRELKSPSDIKQNEVLEYIFQQWQFPETQRMDYWIDECLRFAEDTTLSTTALEIAVNHLLALNVGEKYYNSKNFHKGIGHVLDYQGKTLEENKTETKEIGLSFWNPRAFLALRVRVLLSFLVQKHMLPTPARKLDLIRRELYYTVYTYFINEFMIKIHQARQSDQFFLRGLLINKISGLLTQLPVGGECTIPIGWKGHVLYLCLLKSQNSILLRLDNTDLTHGLDRHPAPINHLFSPVVIASIPANAIDHPLLKLYLQTVFQHRFIQPTDATHQNKILDDIYGKGEFSSKLVSAYPPQAVPIFTAYSAQKASTCTRSGFQVGFRIRCGDVLERGLQALEIAFYREQLQQSIALTDTNRLPPPLTTSTTPLPYSLEAKLQDDSQKIVVTRVTDSQLMPMAEYFSDLDMTEQENKEIKAEETKELKTTIATPISAAPLTEWYANTEITSQQIVISGASGTGKTTLCQYIKSQWGQLSSRLRGLHRFAAILYIPISALSRCHTELELSGLLNKLCFDEKLSSLALWSLKKAITENQLLLLLDGANEMVNVTVDSIEAKNYQKLLSYSHYILTTQPLALHHIPLPESSHRYHRRYLKLHGFSVATTYMHLQKLFPNHKAQQLHFAQDSLKVQTVLQHFCRFPLLLELYSYLTQEAEGKLTITSQSKLLIDTLGYLLKIHLPTCSQTPLRKLTYQNSYDHPYSARIMTLMGALALKHIEQGGILIEQKTIDKVCEDSDCTRTFASDDVLSFKILKIAGRDEQGISSVYFMHEFFRNYSAAYVIAQKLMVGNHEVTRFVDMHRYDNRYRSIWPAVVGWLAFFYQQKQTAPLKQQKVIFTLKNFIGVLQNHIGKDICGFFSTPLLLECLAECPIELYPHIPDFQKLYKFLNGMAEKLCHPLTENRYIPWLSILKNYPVLLEGTQLITALQIKANKGIDSTVTPAEKESKYEIKQEQKNVDENEKKQIYNNPPAPILAGTAVDDETRCRAVCHLMTLATHSQAIKELTPQINSLEHYAKTGTDALLRTRALAALLQWQKLVTDLEIKDITVSIDWQELFNNPFAAKSAYQIFSDRQDTLPTLIATQVEQDIEFLESSTITEKMIINIHALEPRLAYYPLSTPQINRLLPKLIDCSLQLQISNENIFLIHYSLGLTLKMANKEKQNIIVELEKKLNMVSILEEKNSHLPTAIALLTSSKASAISIEKSMAILQENLMHPHARSWILKAFLQYCRDDPNEFQTIWYTYCSFFKGIIQDMPERLLDLTAVQLKFCLRQAELRPLLHRFSLSLARFSGNDLMEIYLAHQTDQALEWLLALLAQRQIAVVIPLNQPHCIMLHGDITLTTETYPLSGLHLQKLRETAPSMEVEQKDTLLPLASSIIQTPTLGQSGLVCQFFSRRSQTTNTQSKHGKKRKRVESLSSLSSSSSSSSSSSNSSTSGTSKSNSSTASS
ncbi:MAG: NACHT domain-containing protein [Proteobacteria bacterium]|nr:NACHT domain-containing protein [Pseudomonadota bacterium]